MGLRQVYQRPTSKELRNETDSWDRTESGTAASFQKQTGRETTAESGLTKAGRRPTVCVHAASIHSLTTLTVNSSCLSPQCARDGGTGVLQALLPEVAAKAVPAHWSQSNAIVGTACGTALGHFHTTEPSTAAAERGGLGFPCECRREPSCPWDALRTQDDPGAQELTRRREA